MWIPQELIIKNLMSIEDERIAIPNGKVPLIFGQNDYDDGQESNGAGKSAILEAFAILLTSRPLRKDCSAKDLVRDNSPSLVLYLKLKNDYLKQTLEIERTFYSNTKSSELIIHINDQEIRDFASVNDGVNDGNQFIIDTIGISKEDLVNYYLISKEKYTPFLKMSDTDKKAMINRFSNADRVEGVVDDIDVHIAKKQTDIDSFDSNISTKQTQIEQIEEMIESLTNSDEDEEEEIDQSEEQLIEYKRDEIVDNKEEIKSIDVKVKDLNKNNEDLEKDKIKVDQKLLSLNQKRLQYKEDLTEQKDILKEIDKELLDVKKVLKDIEVSLLGAVTCPKCTHQFNPTDESIDLTKQRKRKRKGEKVLSEIEEEYDEENKYKAELDQKLDELDQSIDQLKQKKRQADQVITNNSKEIRRLTLSKQSLEDDNQSLQKQIDELLEEKEESDNSEIITRWQKNLDEHQQKLVEFEQEKEVTQIQLDKLVTERSILVQFKTHLANKAIGSIEAHANEYLDKTGSDISIQLDGYTMTKKKEIREKITATILKRGDANKFGRLSSGEKARVELAFIVAPQALINSTCPSGGLDLLFMDEVIESIDSTGIGGLLDSLSLLNQTIFIVTHATYDKPYPYTLTVHKKADGVAVFDTQW